MVFSEELTLFSPTDNGVIFLFFYFVLVTNIPFRQKVVLEKLLLLLLLLFTFLRKPVKRLLPVLDYPKCLVAGLNAFPSRC